MWGARTAVFHVERRSVLGSTERMFHVEHCFI